MEIRYATPYVSGLRWVLNPIDAATLGVDASQVNNAQGGVLQPVLIVDVTPYIGEIAGKPKTYAFLSEPTDLPSVDDVLAAAGANVAETWATALDQMAELFSILQDPAPGDSANGPAYYLRLDSWEANLQWTGAKSAVAVLGVYDSADFSSISTYVKLVFVDGDSLRQRQANMQALIQRIAEADSILATPPTYPNWASLPQDQKDQLTQQAPQVKSSNQAELDRMRQALVAPLTSLLGIPEVQTSIGQLIGGIFAVLKASQPGWADVDVAAVMSRFKLPKIE